MVRLLRWATLLVLAVFVVGVILSYPTLHDRLVGPMLAAPVRLEQEVGVTASLAQATVADVPTKVAVAPPTTLANTALAVLIQTPTPKTVAKNALAADTQSA